jgi:hypothetical protein
LPAEIFADLPHSIQTGRAVEIADLGDEHPPKQKWLASKFVPPKSAKPFLVMPTTSTKNI